LLKNGHSVINVDNFDDFYHYKIKIENTLESVNSSEGFEYKDKESDIQNLINFRIFSKCFFKIFLGIEVVGIFAFVAVVDHIGAVIQLINAFFQGSIKIERIEFLLA